MTRIYPEKIISVPRYWEEEKKTWEKPHFKRASQKRAISVFSLITGAIASW